MRSCLPALPSSSHPPGMWSIGLTCLGASLGCGFLWRNYSKRGSLPPSPPGHWFWGNKSLLESPSSAMLLGTEIEQMYGDTISLMSPFETIIVVNTIDTAAELLEKHAAATANRPRKVIMEEIMGWDRAVSWHPNNERHKKIRRLMASALSPSAARKYADQHTETAIRISKQLMLNPPNFAASIRQELGAFFMRMAYGYVATENDPVIQTAHRALWYYVQGFLNHFWVNDLPILRFLPEWFPGAGFKKFGREGTALRDRYANELFDGVLDQMRHGHVNHASYSSRLLEENGGPNASPKDIDVIRWSAAGIFSGGTSTSVGVIATFLIMTTLYPEMAKKAQAELDAVTGRARLPNLDDADHMPYYNALLQEVVRTFPSVPLGLPHSATEDIHFCGYLIPKGATIYGNIWGMLHDPEQYESPMDFNPDRFLKSTPEPDPRKYIFGFGRRVCPGSHVANNGIWIICAAILAIFDTQPEEGLLAQVAGLGGRNSAEMYKVIGAYSFGKSPCRLVVRDSAASALLENS
ncbi:hypothetical protein FRC08_007853 [Ceratobasidium sp. 394]|nr:hypothetical protein FRC08_007853 [Ceratobasidium sp. 394]